MARERVRHVVERVVVVVADDDPPVTAQAAVGPQRPRELDGLRHRARVAATRARFSRRPSTAQSAPGCNGHATSSASPGSAADAVRHDHGPDRRAVEELRLGPWPSNPRRPETPDPARGMQEREPPPADPVGRAAAAGRPPGARVRAACAISRSPAAKAVSAFTRGRSDSSSSTRPRRGRRGGPRRRCPRCSAAVVAQQRRAVDRRTVVRVGRVQGQRVQDRRRTSSRATRGSRRTCSTNSSTISGSNCVPRAPPAPGRPARRPRLPVRALVGHRAVGLEHREHACGGRDVGPRPAPRGTPPVEALVVVEDGARRVVGAPAPA